MSSRNGEQELLQRRERQLHLTLNPDCAGNAKLLSCLDRVFEQRGLANARLTMHHQDAAGPATRAVQQPVQDLALTIPTQQFSPGQSNPRRRSAHPSRTMTKATLGSWTKEFKESIAWQ